MKQVFKQQVCNELEVPLMVEAANEKNILLQSELKELSRKLNETEEELARQMERQQRLGDITDNYLMLHYLNKNIQECRTSKSVWETYLHNIGDRGFRYTNAAVFLPDKRGEFQVRLHLDAQSKEVIKKPLGDEIKQEHFRSAIADKEVRLSGDNLSVAVPMINNRGSVLALLYAEKERGIFFEDIQLLEVYVQQTIATIENIILNERLIHYQELLGKQMDQFVMLHYIAQEINASKDYDDLMERYLKTLSSPMGFSFKSGMIYVCDERQIQLAELCEDKLLIREIAEIEDDLVKEALKKKCTVLDETRRRLAMPLGLVGKSDAVVLVDNVAAIQPDQVQVLETFAAQTSATLQNTRLNMDLKYLSQHDPLTKLHNRFFFEKEIRRVEKEQLFPAGLIICDLDGLKAVNDNLGHDVGDGLLCEAANLIAAAVPEGMAARIGGDEFAIVVPQTESGEIKAIMQRIVDKMLAYNSDGPKIPVWISLGFAASESPIAMATLIKAADQRMYADKLENGDRRREEIMRAVRAIQRNERSD